MTMLQRFQTLFLLTTLAFLVLLFVFPLMYLSQETKIYCFEIRPLFTLTLVSIVATIAAICLYKARMIQIRISIYNIVVMLGLQGWIAYFYFFNPIPGAAFTFIAILPLCAIIMTLLAIRYIGRDEAILRSINRLRK